MAETGMTPDERDRLVRLEEWRVYIEEKIEAQAATLAKIDQNLAQLVAAANMGKGAWWAALKIGGILVTCGGALLVIANWVGLYVGHK